MLNMAVVLAMLLPLASCSSHHAPKEEEAPAEPASRTVLVYMVASNNLSTFANQDLAEMQQAAAEGQLGSGRLVVYHVPYNGAPVLKEVTPKGVDTLKVYSADDISVSVAQMRKVISDTKQLAEARDYGMIFWSHALGWLQDGIADADDTRSGMAYSFGNDHGKKMNVTALADALDGEDISFGYFDCCYMGSVEVMYELRDQLPLMAASATEDPAPGFPYHLGLKYFYGDQADFIQAAATMYNYYAENPSAADGCPYTMAVVDSRHLADLAKVTAEVYANADTTKPEGYSPQKFSTSGTCYYYDLENYVEALADDEALLARWHEAYDKVILYKASSPYIWNVLPISHFGGLSTYIVQGSRYTTHGYNQLEWWRDVVSQFFLEQ